MEKPKKVRGKNTLNFNTRLWYYKVVCCTYSRILSSKYSKKGLQKHVINWHHCTECPSVLKQLWQPSFLHPSYFYLKTYIWKTMGLFVYCNVTSQSFILKPFFRTLFLHDYTDQLLVNNIMQSLLSVPCLIQLSYDSYRKM